jgi:hypothetical protein
VDAKARFLSFNRTKSMAVPGLLAGHNSLRRHIHLMVISNSPFYRMKPLPTFFVSLKLWLHSDMHIWAAPSWSQKTLTFRNRASYI